MCGNRVEELESRVKELEASVRGLTDELVECKLRLRELEDSHDELEAGQKALADEAAEAADQARAQTQAQTEPTAEEPSTETATDETPPETPEESAANSETSDVITAGVDDETVTDDEHVETVTPDTQDLTDGSEVVMAEAASDSVEDETVAQAGPEANGDTSNTEDANAGDNTESQGSDIIIA